MATPETLGWGHPSEATARSRLVTVTVDNRSFAVDKRVAPLFKGFLVELTMVKGYSIDGGVFDDWSFAYRSIRGGSSLSMHAGLAIDIDATKHALGRRGGPLSRVSGLASLATKWGLVWGGTWSGRPDEMHFEVGVSPARAAQLVATRGVAKPAKPLDAAYKVQLRAKAAAGSRRYYFTLRRGTKNKAWTYLLQARLNHLHLLGSEYMTGGFGAHTEQVVKAFQSRSGLTADGVVGPKTWAKLFPVRPVT